MQIIFLKLMFSIPQKLHALHNDLPFLWEIMKIKKVERFVVNLYDKTECYRHKKFKTSILNHGWILRKVHKVIKFNKKD